MLKKIIALNLPTGLSSDEIIQISCLPKFAYKGEPIDMADYSSGFEPYSWGVSLDGNPGVFALQYTIAHKKIPENYLKTQIEKRVNEIEDKDFRRVSKQEYMEIRANIREQLLPSAIPSISHHHVIFDLNTNMVMFDTDKIAGDIYALITECGKDVAFCTPVLPKTLGVNFSKTVKDALNSGKLEYSFVRFTEDFVIQSSQQKSRKLILKSINLSSSDLRRLIREETNHIIEVGLHVNHASFYLDNRMGISKIKFNKGYTSAGKRDSLYERARYELRVTEGVLNEIVSGAQFLLGSREC